MNEKTCDKCRFFDRGFCKRYPPTFTGARTQYPAMNSNDWCGEFRLPAHEELRKWAQKMMER